MHKYQIEIKTLSNQEFIYLIDGLSYQMVNSKSFQEAMDKAKTHVEFLKKIRKNNWPFM